ncbi:uncharacterized protein LOC121729562 [Aricia agestis]|uniref:uncharacterized protein LOC121729562 n=1 Tax=Aricia agestis TaxID=91739 RepID=UPI001C203A83|nr:uncharacterized protein LOC121729562 [Aricia agestis]
MIIALQALYLFQKSLIAVFEQILEPYLKKIFFYKSTDVYLEEDSDDDVYSEYDENKGVVFFPPVYVQRYAAVSDCLLDTRWRGQLEKVIDFGCNDMSFIKYLKNIPGITEILGVDLEPLPITLDLKHDRYTQKRENPLKITVYQGNAADPDHRLLGSDAVVSIEMIEHMLPHDLERFVHNIFGFIKPWVVVITTPNGDFNELFKALESNGLRRLDHFFEWSREQFHDWCSNIVTRYPEYSVSCKGIGPGPPGTSLLGCCSQLALFVASNYQKQTELSPNSLAIVERESNSAMSDSMDSWDMTESIETSVQSLTTYCECVSFVSSTPSSPIQHKNLQCDVKEEFERNYLMFEEDTFCIRLAREWFISVYHIENVSNRLNCMNNQVKRFSKTTHKLMAKNKPDTLANARDLLGEIRHLSKMATLDTEETIWKNINWGEDAPYWNKYYKIIKEYSYPFAARSEETRILEAISEEITRLTYTSGEDSFLQDDKIEIPIGYIMGLVSHITDDEYQVRELLEWNGYEVVDDTVVYTKLVENEPLDLQKDWIDVASTDWSSTDSQSLEMLQNLPEPDLFEYDLLTSLDQKILSLQRLSKRKDISFELERLVCRVVDLVQDARNGGLPPLPMLLHKLYDLLRVTEKAMMEQRRNFIGDCKRAIKFNERYKEDLNIIISIGIEKTFKAETIVERYESIVLDSCSDQSIENLEYDFIDEFSNREITLKNMRFDDTDADNKIILQSYDSLIEEYELKDVYFKQTDKADTTTCISTQHILSKSDEIAKWRCNQSTECLQRNNNDEVIVIKAKSMRKRQSKFREHKKKLKRKGYGKIKRLTSFAPGYISYFKNESIRNQQKVKMHKEENCYASMCKSIRPIPISLMNIFNLSQNEIEVNQEGSIGDMDFYEQASFITIKHKEVTNIKSTDAEPNVDKSKNKSLELTVTKSVSCHEEAYVKEKVEVPSVFFTHDIDEPSTSDGIRHISADIQCGPDDVMDLSDARSALNITPKIQHTELKIKASITDFQNIIGTNTSKDTFNACESLRKEYVLGHQNDQEIINHKQQQKSESIVMFKKQSLENNGTTTKLYANKVSSKRSSLSYGGIYVHCYKNRNSEDIVYQGKWQEGISNNVVKKAPIVQYRRRREIIVKKNIVVTQNTLNKSNPALNVRRESKRKISYRKSALINVAQRKPGKHNCLDISDIKKKIRHVRLVKPSIGMKPLETSSPITKFLDTSQIFDIKNYIPAYLKRRINKCSSDKKLNLNLNIVLNTYNERKQLHELPLKSSGKSQAAKRNRFPTYLRKFPIYQVYRNEIDKDKLDVKGVEEEKLKKCIPGSSTYVPCSSCSNNNVSFCIKNKCTVDYSSKKSSESYKPGNYTNRIKRVRKLNSIKSLETTKAENVKSRSMETEAPLGVDFDVEATEISNDFNFSNTRLIKFKEAENACKRYNNQTIEIDSAFDKTERSDDVQEDAGDYIEEQVRYLIDKTLSHITRCSTIDNKDGACNIYQFPDDKESINSDYTSTLTLPTASSAKKEIFIVQNENSSKVSIEYSNIDSGVQDVEFLSPISVASATTSKFSEYLSADNEFEELSSLNSNSILSLPQSPDLKENIISKIENPLVPVDILKAADEDNLMDVNNISDTRVEFERDPEVSQRSSEDTYMSCSTEDDVHISYWLFESDSELDRTVTSLPEDDMNETEDSEHETEDETEDHIAGGIGAGDGRGIHSDVSQDTSGRGTSLSGTTSLESEEPLSNRSSGQSEYNLEAHRNPENSEPANEQAVTSNDTPTSPTLPISTDADASSLDNEYEMDSETSYGII